MFAARVASEPKICAIALLRSSGVSLASLSLQDAGERSDADELPFAS
jgi:hypothetical protein